MATNTGAGRSPPCSFFKNNDRTCERECIMIPRTESENATAFQEAIPELPAAHKRTPRACDCEVWAGGRQRN